MTFYFLPHAIPTLIFIKINFIFDNIVLLSFTICIIIFVIWILFNYKSLKISLSKEVIAMSRKENKYTIFLGIYNSIGAAVSEELFFRKFILSIPDVSLILLIFVSILFFVINHYMLPWSSSFKTKDYINQAIFATISSLIFVYSGSILPSIFLHILFNIPSILFNIKCFDRHYIRKNYFDDILEKKNNYNELEI